MTAGTLPRARPLHSDSPLPTAGPDTPSPSLAWHFVKRYTINPASVDTAPLGDILLPAGGLHAQVIWEAIDTSANSVGTFGGLQIAINGGAIDAVAGHYTWTDFSNSNGGAPAGAGNTADSALRAFVTTGGAVGTPWRSKGRIEIQGYNDPTQTIKAFWEIAQVNAGAIFRRSGAGYYNAAVGALTKLHFFSGVNNLGVGSYFELWVAF